VLLESERNIQAKLGDDALARFYKSIADLPMEIPDAPTPQEIHAHEETMHPKDAPFSLRLSRATPSTFSLSTGSTFSHPRSAVPSCPSPF
jgi:hypothetical protein